MIEDHTPLREYVLVDWGNPNKVTDIHSDRKIHTLTEYEAGTKNRAYASNQSTLRFVLTENYWNVLDVIKKNKDDERKKTDRRI